MHADCAGRGLDAAMIAGVADTPYWFMATWIILAKPYDTLTNRWRARQLPPRFVLPVLYLKRVTD